MLTAGLSLMVIRGLDGSTGHWRVQFGKIYVLLILRILTTTVGEIFWFARSTFPEGCPCWNALYLKSTHCDATEGTYTTPKLMSMLTSRCLFIVNCLLIKLHPPSLCPVKGPTKCPFYSFLLKRKIVRGCKQRAKYVLFGLSEEEFVCKFEWFTLSAHEFFD